ncbi:MAG: metallophosphoesterase [Candidatus Brocadiia bacterium]|nr:metallophosphoesterase [Candidatus Brocadiia bacterium]
MSQDPNKLLATSDLHYTLYRTGDACTRELAARVCESDAGVFVIAGDVGVVEPDSFLDCLRLFEGFRGLRFLVPGNHDLWVDSGSSREKYERLLPLAAESCGFHMLDCGPVLHGSTAFIGTIGWYDYSLRNPELGLSTEQYRSKSMPGHCVWNDGKYVKWDLDDEEFLELCIQGLERHYREVEARAEDVVVVLHHLPFADLLYGPASRPLEFCRAYMGSRRLGELLASLPKVRYVICGHRHGQAVCERDGLTALVAGSEYKMKRLIELDLDSGGYSFTDFPAPQAR